MEDADNAIEISRTPLEREWLNRESQLFRDIDFELAWYFKQLRLHGILDNISKAIVLICAVLAPVVVISAPNGEGAREAAISVFGFTAKATQQLSVAITLVLAFAEGARRTFSFQERWSASYMSSQALTSLTETYRDQQISLAIGGTEWTTNFLAFRRAVDVILKADTERFAQIQQSGSAQQKTIS